MDVGVADGPVDAIAIHLLCTSSASTSAFTDGQTAETDSRATS